MQKNSFLLLVLVIVFGNEIKAHEKLSLSDAVKIALQNSYDIKLVENSVTIAKNNNSYGVAGALPNVTTTLNNNNTQTTINQTFPDPSRNTTRSGVEGSAVVSNISPRPNVSDTPARIDIVLSASSKAFWFVKSTPR
jgi:outer membrane protein TolC